VIDPAVLRTQQRAVVRARPRPTLTLVKQAQGQDWRRGLVSCNCGGCPKCKNREAMRVWRLANPRPPARRGTPLDPDRSCACGEPIAQANRSGRCVKCWRGWAARKAGRTAKRTGHYSHGGGI
jgi:hypothetical protein